MKQITAWLSALLTASTSTGRTVRFIAIFVVCGFMATVCLIYFTKAKAKPCPNCEDCSFFKDQTTQLLNALIEVRKDVKNMAETSSYQMDEEKQIAFTYASYDSIPKNKKPQTQQQIKLGLEVRKIDSLLYREMQQIQRQQRKN